MNRVPEPRPCGDPREHAAQEFLLRGACLMGTWEVAGIIPESVNGALVGGWKVMRCGCTFVALLVAESRPSSLSIPASGAPSIRGGSRRARLPTSARPEGVGSSETVAGQRARREDHPCCGDPSSFLSITDGAA